MDEKELKNSECIDQKLVEAAWRDLWNKLWNIDPKIVFWNFVNDKHTTISNSYGPWFMQYIEGWNNEIKPFWRHIPSQQNPDIDGQNIVGAKYGGDIYTGIYAWANKYENTTSPVLWVVWWIQWWATEWYVEYDPKGWLLAWLTTTLPVWDSSKFTPYINTDLKKFSGWVNYTKDFSSKNRTTWSFIIWGWVNNDGKPVAWVGFSLNF